MRALLRLGALVAVSFALAPLALLISAAGAAGGRSGRLRALRILPRVTGLWARINLRLMGVRLVTPDTRPARAGLITSNHLSYLDILVLAALFPSRFVAKREIARWPFLGPLTRSVGTMFLERGRTREVARLARKIQETLRAGISVVFFPEGGISDGRTVQPFFGGLLEAAVREAIECLPACVHYEAADPSVSPAEVICWATERPFLAHFWRLLQVRRVEAEVRWAPSPLTDTDRKRLAERLHRATLAMFTPIRR